VQPEHRRLLRAISTEALRQGRAPRCYHRGMRALPLLVLAGCSGHAGTPASPACEPAVARLVDLAIPAAGSAADAPRRTLRGVLAAQCADRGWPAEATRCLAAATSQESSEACIRLFSRDQSQAIGQVVRAAMPPSTEAFRPPLECYGYKKTIEKLATCATLAPAVRAALEAGYARTEASWRGLTIDDEREAGRACLAAEAAARDAAVGCP
jgi:hypothetical protein